jgi:hypothetical protein
MIVSEHLRLRRTKSFTEQGEIADATTFPLFYAAITSVLSLDN